MGFTKEPDRVISGLSRSPNLSRLVLAFYGSIEHAEEALQEVRKNRFRRSGVVHRTDDGRLKFLHAGLSPTFCTIVATAAAMAILLLGNVLRTDLWWSVIAAVAFWGVAWFGMLWLGLGR